MKKRIIILMSILIVIIIGIVTVCLINNNKEPSSLNMQAVATITADVFKGVIIAKTYNSITVIPNEGEAIRNTTDLVEVKVFENAQVLVNNEVSTIDNIEINDNVAVSFDGQILSIAPTKIIADKIEVTK